MNDVATSPRTNSALEQLLDSVEAEPSIAVMAENIPAVDSKDFDIAKVIDSADGEPEPACVAKMIEAEEEDVVDYPLRKVFNPVPPSTDDRETLEEKIVRLIDTLHCGKYIFGKEGKELFLYDSDGGYFKPVTAGDDGAFVAFLLNSLPPEEQLLALRPNVVSAVIKFLINKDGEAKNLTNSNSRFVNLKNGVLDIATLQLVKKSPDFGFTYEIDACFLEDEKLAQSSKDFFKNLARDEVDKAALWQILGYALSNDRSLQMSAFLVGPPANGKSTILNFLEQLLPEESVCAFSLDDLNDKFSIIGLKSAHVSICADFESTNLSKKQAAAFKRIVAGDKISGRRAYGNFEHFKTNVAMLFASNHPPLYGIDEAVQRRMWLVKTGATVPLELRSPYMLERLWNDRDAIVSKCLKKFSRVYNNRDNLARREPEDFAYDMADGGINISQKELFASWALANIEDRPGAYLQVDKITQNFNSTFALQGAAALASASAGKFLREVFPDKTVKRKLSKSQGLNNVNCLFDAAFKCDDDGEHEVDMRDTFVY